MNNAELIVGTLRAAGVSHGFGIPSGNVLPMVEAMRAGVAARPRPSGLAGRRRAGGRHRAVACDPDRATARRGVGSLPAARRRDLASRPSARRRARLVGHAPAESPAAGDSDRSSPAALRVDDDGQGHDLRGSSALARLYRAGPPPNPASPPPQPAPRVAPLLLPPPALFR